MKYYTTFAGLPFLLRYYTAMDILVILVFLWRLIWGRKHPLPTTMDIHSRDEQWWVLLVKRLFTTARNNAIGTAFLLALLTTGHVFGWGWRPVISLYLLATMLDRWARKHERWVIVGMVSLLSVLAVGVLGMNWWTKQLERQGNFVEAARLLEWTLAIKENITFPNHPRAADALIMRANWYENIGNYAKALPCYQRGLSIMEKALGPDHPVTAVSLTYLSMLYWRIGDYAKALPLSQRALVIDEKALGPDHPITAEVLNNLALLYWSMGEYAQALQSYEHGLSVENRTFANVFAVASEEQKLLFAEQHQKPYFEALSLIYHHFQMDDPAVRFALELVLRRKGIVLDAQSRQQQALTANLEGEALESWQRLTQSRSHLSWLLLSGPGERGLTDYRRAIEELYAAIAREEEFLRQRSGVVAQELAQWQVTAQMLAERLPKASSLVEFVRIKDWDEKKQSWSETSRYLAFVLTPGNRVTLVDLGDAEKIDTTISKTLAAIDDPDFRKDLKAYTRRADSALSELYGLLLQPLGVAVRSRERLIVSPDGELNKVPFAALRTPDGQYLIEKLTVSYLASGRDLLRGKAEVAPTMDLLLVANPAFDDREAFQTAALSEEAVRAANYGERFAPLPGTAEEARAIPLLIKGTQKILEGRQATESAVRLIKSPRVLHLATHGFFLQDKELPLPDLLTSFSLIGDDQERGIGGVKMFSFLSVSARPAGGMMSPMVRAGRRQPRQGDYGWGRWTVDRTGSDQHEPVRHRPGGAIRMQHGHRRGKSRRWGVWAAASVCVGRS